MKLCLRCNQYFEDGIELCPIDTSHLESVGDHPLIGALINDRYVVDSVIGKGSSGIVYKATRLLMGREVAVKVLHSYLGAESGALDRFLREARAASRLRHPHIINIWESGVTDDAQPYFVMDYLEGMTLADLIHDKGYINVGRAMPIITQVCEALAEAHKQGIVHRDIKPENIVLEANEGNNNFDDYVKVLDFGIADQTTSLPGQIRQRTAAGSPAYMSPEQCQGFELDHCSDIYSLAIVIFEMLTGSRPFIADDVMKLFYMHVQQPPPTLSSVRADLKFNPHIESVIARALSKKPTGRQQSIKEFQKELEDAFNNLATPAAPASKGVESVPVDLFSVPVSDRLMDGGKTGNHNFLPGPEDWAEPQAESLPTRPVNAAAVPAVPKGDSPDVSAAVGRLLKSARRASEALKRDNSDGHDWAKAVPASEPATTGGSTGNQSPTVSASENTRANSLPGQDKPEVANWAEKVRNRPPGVSSQELPQYNPGQSDPENLSYPSEIASPPSAPGVPSPPGSEEGMEKFARVTKPSDFLKAKSAEARQASSQSGEVDQGAPKVVAGGQSLSANAQEPAERNEEGASRRDGFLRSSRPASIGTAGARSQENSNQSNLSPAGLQESATSPDSGDSSAAEEPMGQRSGFLRSSRPPALSRPDEAQSPGHTSERKAPVTPQAEETMPSEENNQAKTDTVNQAEPKADVPAKTEQPMANRPSQTAPAPGGRPATSEAGPTPASRPATPPAPASRPATGSPSAQANRPAAPGGPSLGNRPAASASQPGNPTAPSAAKPPTAPGNRPPAPGTTTMPVNRPATAQGAPGPVKPPTGAPQGLTAAVKPPVPTTAQGSTPVRPPGPTAAQGATAPVKPPAPTTAQGPSTPVRPPGPQGTTAPVKPGGPIPAQGTAPVKPPAPTARPATPSSATEPIPPPAGPKQPSIVDAASRLLNSLKKDAPEQTGQASTVPAKTVPQATAPSKPSAGDETKKIQLPGTGERKLPPAPPPADGTVKKSAPGEITKKLLAPDDKKSQAPAGEITKKLQAPGSDAVAAYEKQAGSSLGQAAPAKNQFDLTGAEFSTQPSFLQQKPPADQVRKELEAKNQFAQEVDDKLPAEKNPVQSQETAKPYLDPARFEQPVNKKAESLNKFSEAIEVLLDNAIMPNATEHTRRSLSKMKQFEPEGTAGGATAPEILVPPPSVEPGKDFAAGTTAGANFASAIEQDVQILAAKVPEPEKPVLDRSRFDQPVNRGQLAASGEHSGVANPAAPTPFKYQQETGRIDLKKFDQSINKIPASVNPLAEAIDNALDSAMIKREPPSFMQFKRPEPASPQEPASPAVPPAVPQQEPPQMAPPPNQMSGLAAEPPKPQMGGPEPDRAVDAVSRLIEAAKKAPEAGAAAKPEAYNRKVEEIRKKIEALKVADANKPVGGLPPDQATSSLSPEAPYVAPPNRQPSFAPAAQDPNALSDAVNRLLEAAQRQESASEQSRSYNNAPTYNSGQMSGAASGPRFGAPPNPFDPGASTAMNVTPFGQMGDQALGADNRQEPPKKPSESSPMKSFTNIQSDNTIRAAELINAVRSNKGGDPGPDYYSGYVQEAKSNKSGNLKEGRKSMRKGFQRSKPPLWALLGVAALVSVGAAYYLKVGPFEKPGAPTSVDALIKANRPEKARDILEARKKAGSLTQADSEKLNDVYVKCATKLATDGDFNEAIKTLKLVPQRSKSYEAARKLIREYKRSATQ